MSCRQPLFMFHVFMFRAMLPDLAILAGTIVAAVLLVVVVRWRRGTYRQEAARLAAENVCDHLRPALEVLTSRGHTVLRVGQKHPDLPLEIHLVPPFDPKTLLDELKLVEPVFLSERNVLYCKEDWCELKPVAK